MADELIGSMPELFNRAYQYATQPGIVTAPYRAMMNVGGGMTKDALANLLASILGSERDNPRAATDEAMQNSAPEAKIMGEAGKTVADAADAATRAAKGGRQAFLASQGWRDTSAPAVVAPTVATNLDTSAAMPGATATRFSPDGRVANTAGALSGVRQPRPVVARTGPGPLQSAQPYGGVDAMELGNSALAAPGATRDEPAPAAVAAPVAPEAPQKGLREQYMERLAAMAKGPASTGMTEQQKGMALLEASLAGMAAASKPGASAFGSIGQGGQVGMAAARETEKANRAQAERRRAEDIASLHTEMTLAGQDQNRADTKAERTDRNAIRREEIARETARDTATADYNKNHLKVLEQQFHAGSKKVVEDGKTGTYTILDVSGGSPPVQTGVKVTRKDDTPAEVKLLQALRKDPALLETYKEIKGEKGGISDKDIISQAVELTKSQALGSSEPMETVLQRNIDAVRRAVGKPSTSGGTFSKKSAVYQQYLARPDIKGDTTKLDAALKSRGFAVTE